MSEALQGKFRTSSIPIEQPFLEALEKEVIFPYPSQVTVLGSMFPIPIPKNGWEKMDGKVIKEDGEHVYLKQSKNMVICFPTSAGKTFLIKIFLLLFIKFGTAFYVAPLKSLAEEKYAEFKEQFPSLKIGIMTSDYQNIVKKDVEKYDIIITIYEKFDSLLRNSFNDLKKMISCIAIDEIHNLNSDRGKNIEDFVMKIKKMGNIPIMATSATVGNSSTIAKWLGADLFLSKFRPVPLMRGVLIDDEIEYEDGSFEKFKIDEDDKKRDVEIVIKRKLDKGDQVMYVRATRSYAESFARKMMATVEDSFRDDDMVLPCIKTDNERLLDKCIKHGIAWHHAGLRSENRSYIEGSFRAGKIRFLCATTTLASGVNLPSRHVFLDWKRYSAESGFNEAIPIMEVLQILGRAGRPQYDSIGYGILVCKNNVEYEYCMDTYMTLPPEEIKSPMLDNENLFHSILGNVGIAKTKEDFMDLYAGSLGYIQNESKMMKKVEKTLDSFEKFSEALIKINDGEYSLTGIGKIVKQYYVDPNYATIIIKMIHDCKALSTLSIVHAILKSRATPPLSVRGRSGWAEAIEESVGSLYYDDIDITDRDQVRELQTAMILVGTGKTGEVIYADENITMDDIVNRYCVDPGDIQRIIGPSGKIFWLLQFASVVASYYKKEEIKKLINVTTIRLRYGVSMKLVDLCEIDNVGRERAKALYHVGFKTSASVAASSTSSIAVIDVNGRPIGVTLAAKIIESAKEIANI